MKIFGKISREIKYKSPIRQHQTPTNYIFPAASIYFYYTGQLKVKIRNTAKQKNIYSLYINCKKVPYFTQKIIDLNIEKSI